MATHDIRHGYNVNIHYNPREDFSYDHTVYDQDGAAVDLSEKEVVMRIRKTENGNPLVSLTKTDGDITVGGASNNHVTYAKAIRPYLKVGAFFYEIMNTTDGECIQDGKLICDYKARNE